MNIKAHLPTSAADRTWCDRYVARIGEDRIMSIKQYVYDLCDKLATGQSINIITWSDHVHKKTKSFRDWKLTDTQDLFIKILWCYMTESNGTYVFSNDYQQFKNYIDARTLEKTPPIHTGKQDDKNAGANGRGNWMQTLRAESFPAA